MQIPRRSPGLRVVRRAWVVVVAVGAFSVPHPVTSARAGCSLWAAGERLKHQRTIHMKKLNLVVAASLLALVPVAKAAPPIVGLWDVHYVSDFTGPFAHAHDQWLADGNEIEIVDLGPGAACQGTWKSTSERGIKLNHVGFAFFDPTGPAIPFDETQELTVSTDGKSYDGRYDTIYHTPGGDVEDTGTTHGEKITVD